MNHEKGFQGCHNFLSDPLHIPRATSKDLLTPFLVPEQDHRQHSRSSTAMLQDPVRYPMVGFTRQNGTRSAIRNLKNPVKDITTFDTIIQGLIFKNPFGCTSYRSARKHHPPVEKIREIYTAKFVYRNESGKRIGTGSETYNSVEGYQTGIAAVISNMANIASHLGKVKHLPDTDLFSVLLKCHDPNGEIYFLSLARDRITLSSYSDEAIREKAAAWTDAEPALN